MNTKIIKSNRKTISISIEPNSITVRAPKYLSDDEILNFIEKKKDWINKKLKETENVTKIAKFSGNEIIKLKTLAKEIIPNKVKYYANKIGVDFGKITIRSQKTRWGSCSSKGNLNFNCLLMLFPDKIVDSIVAHELCHRKHMNHSKAFYAELNKAFPEFKECEKWLKTNGKYYISRL